jgi:hypothetical protein
MLPSFDHPQVAKQYGKLGLTTDPLSLDHFDVDWIGLAQDKGRWRAVVNAVMNLGVP